MRIEGPPPGLAALRRHLAARLDRVPRFRCRVAALPLTGGERVWAEDPAFDIARHVHAVALPAPGGMAELRGAGRRDALGPARPRATAVAPGARRRPGGRWLRDRRPGPPCAGRWDRRPAGRRAAVRRRARAAAGSNRIASTHLAPGARAGPDGVGLPRRAARRRLGAPGRPRRRAGRPAHPRGAARRHRRPGHDPAARAADRPEPHRDRPALGRVRRGRPGRAARGRPAPRRHGQRRAARRVLARPGPRPAASRRAPAAPQGDGPRRRARPRPAARQRDLVRVRRPARPRDRAGAGAGRGARADRAGQGRRPRPAAGCGGRQRRPSPRRGPPCRGPSGRRRRGVQRRRLQRARARAAAVPPRPPCAGDLPGRAVPRRARPVDRRRCPTAAAWGSPSTPTRRSCTTPSTSPATSRPRWTPCASAPRAVPQPAPVTPWRRRARERRGAQRAARR